MGKRIILVLLSLVFFSSCVYHKNTLLLKEEEKSTKSIFNVVSPDSINYKLQPGDLLNIKFSSPDKESVEIFYGGTLEGGESEISFYLNSYQVDKNGDIIIPLLGEVKVHGLSTQEVRVLLKEQLSSYFKYLTIVVKLVSFKVTFLGEVTKPSTVRLFSDRAGFFEVLSQVGGLTQFANTGRVKVIRHYDTYTEVIRLDIGSDLFIESEDYYLKPNDIIYIEPLRSKVDRANLSLISVVVSVATFALLFFRTF